MTKAERDREFAKLRRHYEAQRNPPLDKCFVCKRRSNGHCVGGDDRKLYPICDGCQVALIRMERTGALDTLLYNVRDDIKREKQAVKKHTKSPG
jgi:hypothetical protein